MTERDVMFDRLPDGHAGGYWPAPNAFDWRPITPVPDDVPPVIPPHGLGRSSAQWDYRDAEGRLLARVCRWDADGEKEIMPLTFCENGRGERTWRWQSLPKPRPLYGLNHLAARPNDPVLVVEGEKAADAAVALFPDYVAITSPNGAEAAGLSDWSPVRGRSLVIWPDNDGKGRTYASDVARLAVQAGAASAGIVAVPSEWPRGWDLADCAPDDITLNALRAMIEKSAGTAQRGLGGNPDNREKIAPRAHANLDAKVEGVSGVTVKSWPILGSVAARGIVGAIASLATRQSEADPVAIVATTLAWGSASFGRNRFYRVADTLHHARLFCALVGETSRARKGTSLGPVQRIFLDAENILRSKSTLPFPSGLPLNVAHGLSSGEGLVAEVRDKRDEDDKGAAIDKRLLVAEGEFGAVLRQFERQGNTLSTTLRVAWDGADLATMTKNNKDKATAPHICIVGHITSYELKKLLSSTDIWNGVANRVLWMAVRRGKIVPFAQPMPDDEVKAIAEELARVIEFAHGRSHADAELTMSNSAQAHWADCYAELTRDQPGVLGAVTSRAEAQALRLAMAYAQFDGADRIELHHLEAALTFWRYAFDSAAYIFGDAELDPAAQRVIEALAAGPKTQNEIVDLFGRNLSKARIDGVLGDLKSRGHIIANKENETGGRPCTVWRLPL